MIAQLRCEEPTQKISRFDGDALESMTPQATERPPFSSMAEDADPATLDSSEPAHDDGRVPCTAAELELKAQLEVATRRGEMLEVQNMALWQEIRSGTAPATDRSPTVADLEMMLAETNDEVKFLRERCLHFEDCVAEQTSQMVEHHRWLTTAVEGVVVLRDAQAEHGDALEDVQRMLVKRFKDMATAVRSQIDTLEQRLTAKEAAHPSRQGNCSHASDARITHVEDQILGIKATMKDLLDLVMHPDASDADALGGGSRRGTGRSTLIKAERNPDEVPLVAGSAGGRQPPRSEGRRASCSESVDASRGRNAERLPEQSAHRRSPSSGSVDASRGRNLARRPEPSARRRSPSSGSVDASRSHNPERLPETGRRRSSISESVSQNASASGRPSSHSRSLSSSANLRPFVFS